MTTDWRSLVREIEPKARMTAPATDAEIAEAEQSVGIPFPEDVKDLLRQTNGVMDEAYGPVMPLFQARAVSFVEGDGSPVAQSPFPASGYGIVEYTLRLRSDEFADDNGWGEDEQALFSRFVVLGMDIGGGPYGFFVDDPIHIRFVEHDTAEVDDAMYTLEEYLRFFFVEAAWFTETNE